MGISPRDNAAILSASLSTQVTWWPKWAKQAPDTSPTYPVPIMATRMAVLPRGQTIKPGGLIAEPIRPGEAGAGDHVKSQAAGQAAIRVAPGGPTVLRRL